MRMSSRPKAIEFQDDGRFAVANDPQYTTPSDIAMKLHLPPVTSGTNVVASSGSALGGMKRPPMQEPNMHIAGLGSDSCLPTLSTFSRPTSGSLSDRDSATPGQLTNLRGGREAGPHQYERQQTGNAGSYAEEGDPNHSPLLEDEHPVPVPAIDSDFIQNTDYSRSATNSSAMPVERVPHAPTEVLGTGSQTTPRFRMHFGFNSSASKAVTSARVADDQDSEDGGAISRLQVPQGVVGLTNIGNTCFMNASLQCMLRIKPLVEYFSGGIYQNDISIKSPTKGVVANSFASLLKEIQEAGPGARITPIKFQKALFAFAPHLMDEEQQDCQEFLRFLLDGISDDLFRRSKQPKVLAAPHPSESSSSVHNRHGGEGGCDVALMSKTFPLSVDVSSSAQSSSVPRPKSSVARLRSITSHAQLEQFDQRDPDQQLSSLSVASSPQALRGLSSDTIESRNTNANALLAHNNADNSGIFTAFHGSNRTLFVDDPLENVPNDKTGKSDFKKSRSENEAQEERPSREEVEEINSQKCREKAQELAQQAWESHLSANDSIITDLFAGQLQSTIQCLECNHRSYCFDPFLDLSVPIPARSREQDGDKEAPHESRASLWKRRLIAATGKRSQPCVDYPSKCSLEECIEAFSAEETLDGDNMIRCDKCDKRQKSSKKLAVYKCPDILVFHIKRFQYNTVAREKLYTDVNFPIHGLDMKPFLSADVSEDMMASQSYLYDLVSIVHHSGGINGGHYVAHVTYPVKIAQPSPAVSSSAQAAGSAQGTTTGGDAEEKKTMNSSNSISRFLPSNIFSGNFLSGNATEVQGKQTGGPITRSDTEESHNEPSVSIQTSSPLCADTVPEGPDHQAWLCFNDDYISAVPERHISGPSAYILFYQLRR